MALLASIYDLKPSEIGGRIARNGFSYQDHVGVKCLIEMLRSEYVQEIWFETEDDIVILSVEGGASFVEMIQVKSNDLDSRWSVDKLISFEVLQKSLQRGRCAEEVIYRIVTSYDVDEHLSILKFKIGAMERDKASITKLAEKINSKKTAIPVNLKGHGVEDWLHKCWWEKLPDSIDALKSQNLLQLEDALTRLRDINLLLDQRQELYQKMLSLVAEAGLLGKKPNLNRTDIDIWIDENTKNFATPKGGTEKLVEKMNEAQISDSVIEAAKDMKWAFKAESLNHIFVSQMVINKFKGELLTTLQDLKIELDSGTLNLSSDSFHNHCIKTVSKIARKHNIDDNIARGCMYDITNRCSHRFTKVKP